MSIPIRILVAAGGGFGAFLALFPFSGDDRIPPNYYSIFGYSVPVGGIWLALVVGVVFGALVWVLASRRAR